jgi:hypothetical protein
VRTQTTGMKKRFNAMQKGDILGKLLSTKSADRRKAAKEIGKQMMVELGDAVFEAYCKEKKDIRTWETKVEMIISFGLINYKNAISEIEIIIDQNNPHDMITYAAAQSYVRLKRQSLSDAQPVIELLKDGGLSVISGALVPLGHDHMIPSKVEILQLIELGWDLYKHKDRIGYEYGYADPRYGLIIACAGWDKQLVMPFLKHCLETLGKSGYLTNVIENAMKGKYKATR